MENAIQTYSGNLVPLSEIEKAAEYVSKSGMFGVKTKEQAAALMLVAQSEGLHYARAAMAYDVIFGRPALKSCEVLSRFQRAGGTIAYKQSDNQVCTVELSHPQGGTLSITWDVERAKKSGLWDKKDSLWPRYTAQMLRARAVSEGVRALFPACLGGFYAVEEAQDLDALKMEAAETVPPKAQEAEVIPPDAPPKDSKPSAGLTEAETAKLCEWLRTLPDKPKYMSVVKRYCDPMKIGTLSNSQAIQLIGELVNVFGLTYEPNVFAEA